MKIKTFFIILYFFYSFNLASANENKILFKVNNKIITSIDILNEINYLNSLNRDLQNLEKNKIFQIARNSLIREKIKEITLLKIFEEIKLENDDFERIVIQNYSNIKINNINELNNHLKNFDLKTSDLRKKITISAVWNQLIYEKFSRNIKIDIDNIKKEILKDNKQKEFFLSEILFILENNEDLNQKFEQINESINKNGFKNSAMIYSVSDSAVNGGELGWVKENSINTKILNQLLQLQINQHTDPITIPGGFLILKLNEIQEVEKKINLEEEIKNTKKIQTNDQLNQFSNIFLNKVKRDITISEL